MTIGNTGGDVSAGVTQRSKYTRWQLTPPYTITYYPWVNASTTARNVNTKTWSGADRVKYIESEAEKNSRRHFYTIPKYSRRRSASGFTYQQTGTITKSFMTRPIPKRVRRDVENKPNAYTVVWNYIVDETMYQERAFSDANYRYLYQDENVTCRYRSAIPNMSNVAFTANEDLQLIVKLKARIRGSDFDLSVFIGEGHDALRMIASQMTRLAEAGWYTRKGNIKAALKVLSAGKTGYSPVTSKLRPKEAIGASRDPLARNWLELQYGILPLLSDVKAGAEQLSHILHYPKTKRYTAKSSVAIPLNIGQHLWEERKYVKTKRITAYVTEPENLATISGVLDPEIVAWELVPFSFVADWVVPIGDWLEARAFAGKLSATYVTTTTTSGEVKGYLGNSTSYGTNRTIGSNNCGRNYCNSTRVISTTLAVPRPAIKKLDEVFSWMHAANAAALVQAVFSGSRKVKKNEINALKMSDRESLYGVRTTRQSFRTDSKSFL